MELIKVVGRGKHIFNSCNEECYNRSKRDRECVCGGENLGVGIDQAKENLIRGTVPILVKWLRELRDEHAIVTKVTINKVDLEIWLEMDQFQRRINMRWREQIEIDFPELLP